PIRVLSHEDPHVIRRLERCFPDEYVVRATGLAIPNTKISSRAHAFLAKRSRKDPADFWSVVATLLRPGDERIWRDGTEDEGFRALLEFVVALDANDAGATRDLLDGLRGDPRTRILPVTAPGGGRALVALPDPAMGAAGQRSHLVMARVRPPGSSP